MLRNIGIRSKILAVLALPVLVLVLAATVISAGAVADARRAAQVEVLAGQAGDLTRLVRGLQAERALSVAALAGDPAAAAQLEQVRPQVLAGIQAVRSGVGTVDLDLLDEAASEAVASSQRAHDQVANLRAQVDGQALSPTLAAQGYSDVIAADVELAGRIADAVEDRELAAHLRAYTAAERLAELIVSERDLATPAVAAGTMTPQLRDALTTLVSRQDVVRDDATRQADALGVRLPVTGYSLQLARQKTVEDTDGALDGITVEQWRKAADEDVTALQQAEARLAATAESRAAALAQDAWAWAWRVIALTGMLVVLPVVLALIIARRITSPLRRLTEAATEIRRELPTMVERMQIPGEGPGLTLPEIPVTSNDEIGRLAAAFNEVNGATVQVAQEQAALRGSIAAMFVNVARRDQVLLSRQLAFIDQLERTEENPQTLENLFKLDHLATRMRRNAESLLVLAGIDTGRRLRRPMPLSDVVRTASSEIEQYERVDLVLQTDPPVVGHVALITAHLLAELLENATNFSDPHTRVVVSTASGPRGVTVTITDEGLGMSAEELAEANARIAEPPIAEVVGAQRLGFFVVGRLARRLDATVRLQAGRSRGTVVRIDLPAVLFSPGTVVELPAADPLPEDAVVAPAAAPSPVAESGTAALPAAGIPDAVAAPPVPVQDAAPPVTDAGLPRRGGLLPSRVTPSSPVDRPAASPPEPGPAPAADPPAVRPDQVPATGPEDLPRRRRDQQVPAAASQDVAAPEAQVADVAPEAPAGPRAGLFSAFRARRPDETGQVPAVQPDTELPVLAEPLPAPEEVAAPAAVTQDVVAAPVVEPVVEPVVAEPVVAEPVVAEVPVAQPAPFVEPAPVGAAALDILPGRAGRSRGKAGGSRGLFGRRGRDGGGTPPAAPVQPMTRRELRAIEVDPLRPAPWAPSGPPAPVSPAVPVSAAPAPLGDPPSAAPTPEEPVPAPSSLFTVPAQPAAAEHLRSEPAPAPPVPAQPPRPAPEPAAAVPLPAAPAAQPVPVVDGVADVLRQRSALASEALTELSRLSTYSPPSVETKPPATLSRRTPAATPAAELAAPQPVPAARRTRNAADVRSMLSGFQAGVERGRTSPGADDVRAGLQEHP